MKKNIRIPLEKHGTAFTEENQIKWDMLSRKEKLFYRYLIENDLSLSSILVGVFSAYVVNDFSNLIGLSESWYYIIIYSLNVFFAVYTLWLIIRLYSIHVRKERRDTENNDTIYVNESFSRIFKENQNEIKEILNQLLIAIWGILITLILCFGMKNISGICCILFNIV